MHARRGFTLIELLVVIAVIGLLAAALLPNIFGATVTAKVGETRGRIQQLRLAVEAFERKYAFYPPANFKPLDEKALPMKVGKDNGINSGIESLLAALHMKSYGGPTFDGNVQWLGNTDGDKFGEQIPLMGSDTLYEVLDSWGNPIVYFHLNEQNQRQRVRLGENFEEEEVRVAPMKLGGRSQYQLMSFGPDGYPDTGDEITWPEAKPE